MYYPRDVYRGEVPIKLTPEQRERMEAITGVDTANIQELYQLRAYIRDYHFSIRKLTPEVEELLEIRRSVVASIPVKRRS